MTVSTVGDPYKPSWWPGADTEIKLAVSPLRALMTRPIDCQGQQFTPAKETRFTYSESTGHVDALRQEYENAKAAERASSRLIKAWTPGQITEENHD